MKSNKLILIKLGGGLIAPKNWAAETPDVEVIKRLVGEIAGSGVRVVVVSGSGNFGHAAVKKFGVDTQAGVKKVRVSAQKIGRFVAGGLANSRLVITHRRPWRLAKILDTGMTPVIYGDVMGIDEIWSGERCLGEMLPELIEGGWKVEKIVQVSLEEGVYDNDGRVIPEINLGNWEKYRRTVGGGGGTDVTGGMLHKVEESLKIADKYKISTWIISGKAEGRLGKALLGVRVPGTVVG